MPRHRLESSIAFGVMDGTVTLLGVLLAMYAISAPQHIVITAILATAIADGIANAAGLHVSEEAMNHARHVVWKSTFTVFIATFIVMCVPLIPIIFLDPPISYAIAASIGLLFLFALGLTIQNWKFGIEYAAMGILAGGVCYIVSLLIPAS